MPDFTIRDALPSDRGVLIKQFQGLNVFEDAFTADRATSLAEAEICLDQTARRVDDTGGHRLVAERDGVVVGHMFLSFPRQLAHVREALCEHAYVNVLYVREDQRGGGIGRALLAEAERLTRARGLRRMLIGFVAGNDRAETTYRLAGYAPYAHELIKTLD
jgi:GNAT superfamily N-acetyltransferase